MRPSHVMARRSSQLPLACCGCGSARCSAQTASRRSPRSTSPAGRRGRQGPRPAQSLPQAGAGAAEAQNLLCRVRFTLQQWDAAAAKCEQAVQSGWAELGRSPVAGPRAGRKGQPRFVPVRIRIAKHSLSELQTAVTAQSAKMARPRPISATSTSRLPESSAAAWTRRRRLPRNSTRWTRPAPTSCGAHRHGPQGLRHGRARVQAGGCRRPHPADYWTCSGQLLSRAPALARSGLGHSELR